MFQQNVEDFKIQKAPPTVYYIPEFITKDEERQVIDKVNAVPKPKWTQLSNRRLQNWGGIPHPKGMITEVIPQWLDNYIGKVKELNVFPGNKIPNHVLINEYLPGQGIMPHSDGPLFHPIVTTISCGSPTVLEFKPKLDPDKLVEDYKPMKQSQELSLFLERRSLLVLCDALYHDFLHTISERSEDVIAVSVANIDQTGESFAVNQTVQRGTRISLTIRHVPKAIKFKLGPVR